jgi:tRNA isopentenyl-2-thiomethyl-A-37 hydroxylase MiaE
MKVSVITLLEKLMYLEENLSEFYHSISKFESDHNQLLKNTAKILMREELRRAKVYRDLIDQLNQEAIPAIDQEIVNQADYNIIMLKRSMNIMKLKDEQELMTLAIDFDNQKSFVLQEIINEVKKDADGKEILINIFESLLKEEVKHIKNLRIFLKKPLY